MSALRAQAGLVPQYAPHVEVSGLQKAILYQSRNRFRGFHIGLDKWLCAMFLIANCKNGVSSYEIARDIHVTQKSAWFMLQRIRHAMHTGTLLSGQIEADETSSVAKLGTCIETSAPKRSRVRAERQDNRYGRVGARW